ncbi:MAG: aminotransferase class V-fold PLP-dependent enzyme [Methanomassiliicoccales archaeon]|nr:MAG: aminotransferase class V-fold PLP-dependent enzyme [Methanomassiliicoccales archaeon]
MDVDRIRNDFPCLQQSINGRVPIYFDSACTTLRPVQVIDAMNEYYTKYPSCGGRSVHKFGTEVTIRCDDSRDKIQKLLNAEMPEEIVFVKNTTEGINLVANSLGFEKGDVVLGGDKEHNSNLVPWQVLSDRIGSKYDMIESDEDGSFSMENMKEKMSDKVKMVSIAQVSNLDGSTVPAKDLIEESHDHGSLVLFDSAQAVPHMKIDVQDLDIDFLCFSLHKMCGPSGMGVLYGKYDLLDKLDTFLVGGSSVADTTYEDYKILKPPQKFEAGLQNFSGIIGSGAAVDYLMDIGMEEVHEHEKKMNTIATKELSSIPGVRILGPEPEKRGGILAFLVDGMEPHDVAMILDEVANIMIRSGMHCNNSWFNAHGINGSSRASFYIYNTEEEVHIFKEELEKIVGEFR